VPTIQPLNTSEIEKFLTAVKNAENSRAKELRIDIQNAKNLAFTLGIVMSRLHGDLEKLITDKEDNQTIEIKLDQGSGWN
jgi:hypothetical protein